MRGARNTSGRVGCGRGHGAVCQVRRRTRGAGPQPAAQTQGAAASAGSVAAAGTPDEQVAPPDSVEQGHTQMADSFDRRPIAALLHESSLVGLRDTTLSAQLRSFELDRINFDGSASEAWTLGGSAGFKTGYFGDFAAVGATGYTSQRLYGPLDKDGTKLLQTGQEPYTVMGEIYGQFRLVDEIVAVAGRKGLDTPYINTQDSLMTPNTFTVYTVQGTIGSTDEKALRFGAGYVDQIKVRNGENFESMATAAGAPAGVDRGVYVAGANFRTGAFSIGLIDYDSADIINIVYTELKYSIPIAKHVNLRLASNTRIKAAPAATCSPANRSPRIRRAPRWTLGSGPRC